MGAILETSGIPLPQDAIGDARGWPTGKGCAVRLRGVAFPILEGKGSDIVYQRITNHGDNISYGLAGGWQANCYRRRRRGSRGWKIQQRRLIGKRQVGFSH